MEGGSQDGQSVWTPDGYIFSAGCGSCTGEPQSHVGGLAQSLAPRGVQRLFIPHGHHDQNLRYLIILKEPFRNPGYDYDVFFFLFFFTRMWFIQGYGLDYFKQANCDKYVVNKIDK